MGADVFTPGLRFARYELLSPLGEGAMGAVWKARHLGLKKLVVVKTLKGDRARSPHARARFKREGEAASRVRHPHVVELFDVGEHRGAAYLVMELLEGHDLGAHLAQRGSLSPEEAADVLVPVCSAVSAAHAAGVIHRDLKPENIFLARARDRGGVTPKVLDFGISRIEEPASELKTATAALLGTPSFMAPEQARDAAIADARSDQYALGAVLYRCVTGRLPVDEASVYEQLRRVVHGEYDPPSRVRPDLSPEFEGLILRAMALDPGARFESVRALGAALLPFASERTRAIFHDAFRAPSSTLDDDAPPVAPVAPVARTDTAPPALRPRGSRVGLVALVGATACAVIAAFAWDASQRPVTLAATPSTPVSRTPAPSPEAPPARTDAPPAPTVSEAPVLAPTRSPAAPTRIPLAPRRRVVAPPAPTPALAPTAVAPPAPSRPAPTTNNGLVVD